MILKFLGLILLAGTLIGVYLFEASGSTLGAFRILHWPAIFLTGLGPIGIIFVCSDTKEIRDTLKFLFNVSLDRLRKRREFEANDLHALSQKYYLHGAKVFDESLSDSASPFLKRTVKCLSLRIPFADVRGFLERDREKIQDKLERSIILTGLGVRMAPSVGMLGTILGMVQLLASLKDPSQIGSHMSLALLTTFYGLFFSLVFWTPVVHHLKSLRDIELESFDQLLHWVEVMEERKPAQYLADDREAV